MNNGTSTCELCGDSGGQLLWQNELFRIVLVDDHDYPGFCRVILNRHLAEMSDLPAPERHTLMEAVFAVEAALRQLLDTDKINLASLGNMTPHVHWHVIPRWRNDRCFPNPIWGTPRNDNAVKRPDIDCKALRQALETQLGASAPSR